MIVTLGEGAMYSHKVQPQTMYLMFVVLDTFLSAFALLQSFDEVEVRFANGVIAVSKFGNYSPKIGEIL